MDHTYDAGGAGRPDRPMRESNRRNRGKRAPLWVIIFLVMTIVLAGLGFLLKLIEFISSWMQSDGTDFAIAPVAAYLAMAGGFICLFIWAWRKGQFRDIEAPKYRMLELQEEIDARGGRP